MDIEITSGAASKCISPGTSLMNIVDVQTPSTNLNCCNIIESAESRPLILSAGGTVKSACKISQS